MVVALAGWVARRVAEGDLRPALAALLLPVADWRGSNEGQVAVRSLGMAL